MWCGDAVLPIMICPRNENREVGFFLARFYSAPAVTTALMFCCRLCFSKLHCCQRTVCCAVFHCLLLHQNVWKVRITFLYILRNKNPAVKFILACFLELFKPAVFTPKWIVKITEMLREKNPCSSWQAILHLPWPLLPCLRHKTKWRRPLLKPPHHTLMLRRNRHCLKLPTIWPISWTISPKFILNCLLMISKVLKYMCIDHMAQTIFLGLSHTLGTACKLGRSIFVKSIKLTRRSWAGLGQLRDKYCTGWGYGLSVWESQTVHMG